MWVKSFLVKKWVSSLYLPPTKTTETDIHRASGIYTILYYICIYHTMQIVPTNRNNLDRYTPSRFYSEFWRQLILNISEKKFTQSNNGELQKVKCFKSTENKRRCNPTTFYLLWKSCTSFSFFSFILIVKDKKTKSMN